MRWLRNLKPTDTDVAMSYAELTKAHEPRMTKIGGTNAHACSICDEVWPCDTAIVLAGFREYRLKTNRVVELLGFAIQLLDATMGVVVSTSLPHLDNAAKDRLIARITAIRRMIEEART